MNKKITWLIVAVVVAISAYLYASPYLVLNSIKKAAQAGDSEQISAYVDYPSVRQSFKDQMNAYMVKEMASKPTDGWEALGAMMATAMVDKMVDAVITPEGMTLMLQGKDFKQSMKDHSKPSSDESSTSQAKVEYKTRYLSMNLFEARLKNNENEKELKVILERDGLSWKVKKFVIPMDDNSSTASSHIQESSTQQVEVPAEISPVVTQQPEVTDEQQAVVFDHSGVQKKGTLQSCYRDPCSVARVMEFKQLSQTPTESNIELTVVGGSQGFEAKNVEWNHEAHKIRFKCSLTQPTVYIGDQETVVPLNNGLGVPGVLMVDSDFYTQACHNFEGDNSEIIQKYGYSVADPT